MTDALTLGQWWAAEADDITRREGLDPDHDERRWEPVPVPGHWRTVPAFSTSDGPLIYRTRFEAEPAPGDRSWLVLHGAFYTCDVWIDGSYLGDTEGYFAPHRFDISEAMSARADHVVSVEVACPRPTDLTAKRCITGVFQHWDLIDQDANPGGLWRPVCVERTGPVRVDRLRVHTGDIGPDGAVLHVQATLDALAPTAPMACHVLTRVTPVGPVGAAVEHRSHQSLARGPNELAWSVTVPEPRLWWPRSLGDQPLYDLTVEVEVAGRSSHAIHRRTGIRRVALRNWIASVNGERLHLKGVNHGPTRYALGDATPDELTADVDAALGAHLDLLRVHAHITRPELYDAADERGLLLWQDLPLQWGYSRSIRHEAVRQAAAAVDLLGHHPSIAVWCAHNEPMAIDVEPVTVTDRRARNRLLARAVTAQMLPTWNKTVLDRSLARTLRRADPSRPVIPHSGIFPHPPQLDGTDTHVYFGWYVGRTRDFGTLVRRWPRLARFVSEFGAQAVPDDHDFLDGSAWPDLDWDRAYRAHALQKPFFDRVVPPASYPTLAEWARATQQYQAELLRYHVETLRRIKYRPNGGFAAFCLADNAPAVTWSVLDHRRRPKLGYGALRAACRPLLPVADWPPDAVAPGRPVTVPIHVVSDLREPLAQVRLDARLQAQPAGDAVASHLTAATPPGGDPPGGVEMARSSWVGGVPADGVVWVGDLVTDAPPAGSTVVLDLHLTAPGHDVRNRYVSPGPGGDPSS